MSPEDWPGRLIFIEWDDGECHAPPGLTPAEMGVVDQIRELSWDRQCDHGSKMAFERSLRPEAAMDQKRKAKGKRRR